MNADLSKEIAMQNFDRFLLTVLYDIPSLIFVVDAMDARIIYANQYMKNWFGEDCIGMPFSERFCGAGGKLFFISYIQQQSTAAEGELDMPPQQSEYYDDETENWYHVLQRHITWIDGSRKIAFSLNEINGQKRLQKELSEAHATLAFKNGELEIAAKTDRLTRLYNRHHLDAVIAQEFTRFRRSAKPFAVLIADCDKFKSVNDTYGHQIGDLVLIDIARLLRENVRATDTVGRWGGEEFLAILPDTGIDGAVQLAEKLRVAIETNEFPTVGQKTASFGIAVLRPDEGIKELIARADTALYRAKENGRNRVETIA